MKLTLVSICLMLIDPHHIGETPETRKTNALARRPHKSRLHLEQLYPTPVFRLFGTTDRIHGLGMVHRNKAQRRRSPGEDSFGTAERQGLKGLCCRREALTVFQKPPSYIQGDCNFQS